MRKYTKLCARLTVEADDASVESFFDAFFTSFVDGTALQEEDLYDGPSEMAGPFRPRVADGVPVYIYELRRLNPNSITFFSCNAYAYFFREIKAMQRAHPNVNITLDWANRASEFPGARTRIKRTASGTRTHTSGDPELIADEDFEHACFNPSGIIEIE